MALTVWYKWTCDICKGEIASPFNDKTNKKTYMSGADLTRLPPVVRYGMQAGHWALCDECWGPIADALEKRVAEMKDIRK